MAITSLGVGSGLDLNSLLTNLMQSENVPLTTLQKKEASYQTKISALGNLSGALAALQTAAKALVPATGTTTAAKYTTYSASVADSTIASASAGVGAVSGSYSLAVSALATSQRLVTPASSSSKSPYTSASSTLTGTGDLKIELGTLSDGAFTADSTRSKTITINSSNNTLGGLRDAINAANIGATATIVTGTNGAQLVLSSASTGLSNVIKLSVVADSGDLTGFDYNPATNAGALSQLALNGGQAATDAAFTLNGIPATSSTNTVTGALEGVTLTLLKTSATDTPTTLTVSKNSTGNLTTALTAFVKAYNEANTTIASLGAYDAKTKTAGALQGDSTLRTAKNQIRSLIFSATAGGTSIYQRLSNIGVTLGQSDSLTQDGSLYLNTTKLNAAVAADPTGVANLVVAVGSAYNKAIESLVSTKAGATGSITSATEGTNRTIKDIANRQLILKARLATIETNYIKQFSSLDTLIAGLKQTQSALTSQLASITANTSSSSK